jgi:hypothetical protein
MERSTGDVKTLKIWYLAIQHDFLPMILVGLPFSIEAQVDAFQEALAAVSGNLT